HNLLVDRYRRAGKEAVELSRDLRDHRPQADPAAMAQSSEDRRRLFAAIQRLTAEQQQVITMRYIDNLEVEEIARLTHRRAGATDLGGRAADRPSRCRRLTKSWPLQLRRGR